MAILRGMLCIRRVDRGLNAQIRELCEVTKKVNKRIEVLTFIIMHFLNNKVDCGNRFFYYCM